MEIGIYGLGLMGGSLAKALKRAGGMRISACNRSVAPLKQALAEGVVDAGDTAAEVLRHADIVFVCVPLNAVSAAFSDLQSVLKPGAAVTDIASVKSPVLQHIGQLPEPRLFIGGHPMAGRETLGYGSSVADLYDGRPWILCPSRTSSAEALELVKSIVTSVGAIVYEVPAEDHDRQIAYLSHLPHLLAYGLTQAAGITVNKRLAGPSWDSATRVAGSPPEMWTRIAMANREELAKAAQAMSDILLTVKQALDDADEDAVKTFFRNGYNAKMNDKND